MPNFLEIPEALDHLAGQAWLSPDIKPRYQTIVRPSVRRLGLGEALHEIAGIVRRIGRS